MAISADSQVAFRRFSGFLDPRFPEGYWLGSVTLSGDASGGQATANLIFSEATQPALDSRMYSLEQLSFFRDNNSDIDAGIFTDNLGLDGPAALTNNYHIEGATAGTLARSPVRTATLPPFPIWLGSMRVTGVQTRLALAMLNVNGTDLRFEAQGYWWGPRSILVDGGPQRPPTGLYKA